jgi:hypothetical protein
MYAVTCPSCENKQTSPFARVDAVMVCPKCKKTVQLRPIDVKRQVRIRTDVQDELFTVQTVQHGAPARGNEHDPEQDYDHDYNQTSENVPANEAEYTHQHEHGYGENHVAADVSGQADYSGNEYENPSEHAAFTEPGNAAFHVAHDHEATTITNGRSSSSRSRSKRTGADSRARAAAANTGVQLSGAQLAKKLAKRRKLITMTWMSAAVVALVAGLVVMINMVGGNKSGKDAGTVTFDGATDSDKDSAKDSSKDGGKDGSFATSDSGHKDNSVKDKSSTKDKASTKDRGASKDKVSTKDKKPPPSKDKATGPDKVRPVKPKMVVAKAMLLGDRKWNFNNESFNALNPLFDQPETTVLFVDAARNNDVLKKGQWLSGKIISDVTAVGAVLDVKLVNDEDRIYARIQRTIPMLEAKKPRDVRLLIPKKLLPGLAMVDWSVAPIDTQVRKPILLSDGLAQIKEGAKGLVLNVSALNPAHMKLSQAMFVIQQMTDSSTVQNQWRARYDQVIGSRKWIKFEVEMPENISAKEAQQSQWRVFAAGIADVTGKQGNGTSKRPIDTTGNKSSDKAGDEASKNTNVTKNGTVIKKQDETVDPKGDASDLDPGERRMKKDIRNRPSIFD